MSAQTKVSSWSELIVDENATFTKALEIITKGGLQIALINNDNDKGNFCGVITDSDIRKSLLKGLGLGSRVKEIMNSSPLVVSPDLKDLEASKIMLLNHFCHLPIVDATGQLCGLHVAEHLTVLKTRSETFIIMAGGKGKRLMPLTEKTPKPMLLIKGKPILEYIIDKAKSNGFINILISVNYLSEKIIEYFGNGQDFGVNITYMHEEKPLGTAGSLSQIPYSLRSKYLFITNADIITEVSYGEMLDVAIQENIVGLMGTRMHEWQNPFGVVTTDGNNIVSIDEKPIFQTQVNAGLYVLSKEIINRIKANTYFDMPDLFSMCINDGQNIKVYPIHESWIDIGNPSDYERAAIT